MFNIMNIDMKLFDFKIYEVEEMFIIDVEGKK